MDKTKLVVPSLFLLISGILLAILFISTANASGATLYVGGTGGGNYTTIQNAINAASAGDTIYVYNGTYNEQVTIGKSVNLTGESNQNTTIKGSGGGNGIYASANYVNISNIKIDNFNDGIYLISTSNNNNITSNTLMNCSIGIYLVSSSNNIVASNTLVNCNYGIPLSSSSNNNITSNTVTNCSYYGIYLSSGSNNNITANTLINCSYYGIYLLSSSSNNNITSNTVTNCSYSGIYVYSSSNNNITSNTLTNCTYGIDLSSSSSNILINTSITDSDTYDIRLTSSSLTSINSTLALTIESLTVLSAKLPSGRRGTASVWDGTNVYIFGGWDGNNAFDEILKFNISTGNLTTLSAKLPNKMGYISAILNGTNIYIFGGTSNGAGSGAFDQIIKFNITTEEATTLSTKLPSKRYGTSAIWDGTNAYIFGGDDGNYLDQILKFNPSTGDITTLSSKLPSKRYLTSAIWGGTNAYVFGGRSGSGDLDQIVKFNPTNGTVITLSSKFPSDVGRSPSAIWDGTNAYIFGGEKLDQIAKFSPGKVYCDANSKLTIQNYLDAVVRFSDLTPIQNAYVNVTDNGALVYSGQTDAGGKVSWVPVTDRVYNGSSIATENITIVNVSYAGFVFSDNNRSVNMSTPHTEQFTANNPPNNPPTSHITTPTEGQQVAQGVSLSLSGYGEDAEDGFNMPNATWYYDGGYIYNANTSVNTADWTTGVHTIFFNVTDSGHLTATAMVNISIVAANNKPTAYITTPTEGQSFIEWQAVNFTGYGTDAEDGFLIGTSISWSSNISGVLGTGNISKSNLPVGSHSINLTVSDSISQTASAGVNITVLAANLPGTPSITTIPYTDIIDGNYDINWTSSTYAEKYVLEENNTVAIYNGTALTYPLTNKSDGTYTYRVRAWNINGTSNWSATITIVVDVAKLPGTPTITTQPYTDTTGNYSINWTASSYASKYTLYENDIEVYNGTALTKDFTNKPNSNYVYNVRAWNINGTSANSSAVMVIVSVPGAPNLPYVPSITTVAYTDTEGSYAINWSASDYAEEYELYENGLLAYNGANLTMAFSEKADDTYIYKVRARNINGTSANSSEVAITVSATAPKQMPVITNITLPPYISMGALLVYTCTATDSDGYIAWYLWDFGDGTSSGPGQYSSYQHTYLQKGNYTITVTVSDNDGLSTAEIRNISLENIAPTPKITEPLNTTFNTSETISFSASDSFDGDGDYPLTFLWEFNDRLDPSNSSNPNATHTYKKAGAYNVTITVKDNKSAPNSMTLVINITNRLPKPSASVTGNITSGSAVIGSTLQFDASKSDDDDGDVVGYQWEIDGYNTSWSTVPYYNYTFNKTGTYTTILRVLDDDNGVGETTIAIAITPRGVTPIIYYDESVEHMPGEKITFHGLKSLSGTETMIISYKWDFGDKAPTVNGTEVTHVYNHSGKYLVTLSVTDNKSKICKTTVSITIENIPPIPVISTRRSGKVGEVITFDASKSVDRYGKIVKYTWDFGDDTNETGESPVTTHAYKDTAYYTVKLTVVDDNGTSNSTTLDSPLMIFAETPGGSVLGSKWSLDDPNVLGLIVSGIGLAVGYVAYTARKKKLSKNIKDVTAIYVQYRHKPEYCEEELNKIRQKFFEEFENGKLDGNNYLILEKKIDNYVKELRTKTLEAKMGAMPTQVQQTAGDIIASGRISKEEYDNLMNGIKSADIDENQRKQMEQMFSAWMKSDDRFMEPVEIATPLPQKRTAVSNAPAVQRVRCAKCNAKINVSSSKRPLVIYCPKCGMKGILKGNEPQ